MITDKLARILANTELVPANALISALEVDECLNQIWLRDRIQVFGLEQNVDYFNGENGLLTFTPEACLLLATTAQSKPGDEVRGLIRNALETIALR